MSKKWLRKKNCEICRMYTWPLNSLSQNIFLMFAANNVKEVVV